MSKCGLHTINICFSKGSKGIRSAETVNFERSKNDADELSGTLRQVVLTAVFLVALVQALRSPGAHEVAGNAGPVLALELVRPASDVLAHGWVLVGAVRAVVVSVAEPRLVDAADVVPALELPRSAVVPRPRLLRAFLRSKQRILILREKRKDNPYPIVLQR